MRNRELLQSSPGEALAQGSEPRGHTVFVGGFPCQDLSIAGKRTGRKGARSGLYRQYLAVIAAEKPAWIVTENVGHTWRKWVPHLRRSLHRLGYASLPLRVLASDLGAPHQRSRVFIVAHADGELLRKLSRWWVGTGRQMADEFADHGPEESVAHADGEPECKSKPEGLPESRQDSRESFGRGGKRGRKVSGPGWWAAEPGVGRVAHGVPSGVDRLTAVGNAIVPFIAEIIAAGIKAVTHAGEEHES